MNPEKRIRNRVRILLDCTNLAEVSRRTGYPRSSLQRWKDDPLCISAVTLETLEELLGTGKEGYKR